MDTRNVAAAAAATSLIVSLSDKTLGARFGVSIPGAGRLLVSGSQAGGAMPRLRATGARPVRASPSARMSSVCARKSLSEMCVRDVRRNRERGRRQDADDDEAAADAAAAPTVAGRRRDFSPRLVSDRPSLPVLQLVAARVAIIRDWSLIRGSDGSECRIVVVVRHNRPRRRDAPRSISGSGNCQAKIAVSTRDRIDCVFLFLSVSLSYRFWLSLENVGPPSIADNERNLLARNFMNNYGYRDKLCSREIIGSFI